LVLLEDTETAIVQSSLLEQILMQNLGLFRAIAIVFTQKKPTVLFSIVV